MTFQDVLDDHMKKRDNQMRALQYVKEVCEDLKEKEIPILEAMTNEKIIDKEKINQENVKSGVKKIFDYFKPMKTVVIGYRVEMKDYLSFLPFALFVSIVIVFITGIGFSRFVNYANKLFENRPKSMHLLLLYEASWTSYIKVTTVVFIMIG